MSAIFASKSIIGTFLPSCIVVTSSPVDVIERSYRIKSHVQHAIRRTFSKHFLGEIY